jgi:hypothetical protein
MSASKLEESEIGNIIITKVSIEGKTISHTQEDQILKIKPTENINPNEKIILDIEFTLKLPRGTNRLGHFNDVYSFTNWYPILSIYNPLNNTWDENPFSPIGESNYSEASNYDVTMEVSKNMIISSTGIDKSITYKDNKKIFNVVAENVRDFVFIMSPKFNMVSKTVNGVKIKSFYYEDEDKTTAKKQAYKLLDVGADSITFFSDTFGSYPYKEFDIVETFLSGGAMEYPQLIQMGQYSFNPDINYKDTSNYIPFEIEATVHEIGHQWWFSIVGNNEFQEPFLDESLTVYSTAYYFEKQYGKLSSESAFSQFRLNFYPEKSEGAMPINTSVNKFSSWSDYSMTIYRKGPLVFEDLRQRVGEEKFLEILKNYFNSFKYKNATIEGLLDIVGQVAGEDIEGTIKDAINSKSYSPENLMLPEEERREIYQEKQRVRLLEIDKKYGISLDSIIARGILGEDVYIIKPTLLSQADASKLDSIISMLQENAKNQYGIVMKVKTEEDLSSEEIKNNNLILLGNPWNNQALNSINSELPISLTKYSLTMNDLTIYNSNISGQFSTENPYNKAKVVLVFFWTKELNANELSYYGGSYYEMPLQFNITINSKKTLSGRYE